MLFLGNCFAPDLLNLVIYLSPGYFQYCPAHHVDNNFTLVIARYSSPYTPHHMAPPSRKDTSSSSHDNHGDNTVAGLLVPHTAFTERGDKLTVSSRKPLVPPSTVIPIEEPKRKKRKYHPELIIPAPASHSRRPSPVVAQPSLSQKRSHQDQEFLEGHAAQWDDGIYVGANNHPLYDISAIPVESEQTSKGKVSFLLTHSIHMKGGY